jgi:formylglycine-generating enzyme required for sulfatase activity
MGSAEPADPTNPDHLKPDEFPAHEVELDGYWMDETPVTNSQYREFVDMTGYLTFAEKKPTREDFARSGADVNLIQDKDLVPGSMCFNCAFNHQQLVTGVPNWEYQVWQVVQGASWRHPDGPASSIDDRLDHPVVHVNWDDAVAYCEWAGKRLPTEAEFEYASRGGRDTKYAWGDELVPQGKYQCNFWQGTFPTERLNLDGFQTSSPVKSFPPNGYGLYDMAGNVWQWCSDFYRPDYYTHSPRGNPRGPSSSFDPQEPAIIKRVQRGGSFMCNTNSCTGYRCAARMRGEVTSSSFHNGFRCVVDATMRMHQAARQQTIADWRNRETR